MKHLILLLFIMVSAFSCQMDELSNQPIQFRANDKGKIECRDALKVKPICKPKEDGCNMGFSLTYVSSMDAWIMLSFPLFAGEEICSITINGETLLQGEIPVIDDTFSLLIDTPRCHTLSIEVLLSTRNNVLPVDFLEKMTGKSSHFLIECK